MKNAKRIVLALGSNVGNRRENLVRALAEIENFARILSRSKIYETAPVGFADQRDFLNAAVLCETQFEPLDLLEFCKSAEARLGRTKTFPNGPREIDIDIIFYEGRAYSDAALQIPHPRWSERDFVLAPLADILDSFETDFCCDVAGVLGSAPKNTNPLRSFKAWKRALFTLLRRR